MITSLSRVHGCSTMWFGGAQHFLGSCKVFAVSPSTLMRSRSPTCLNSCSLLLWWHACFSLRIQMLIPSHYALHTGGSKHQYQDFASSENRMYHYSVLALDWCCGFRCFLGSLLIWRALTQFTPVLQWLHCLCHFLFVFMLVVLLVGWTVIWICICQP